MRIEHREEQQEDAAARRRDVLALHGLTRDDRRLGARLHRDVIVPHLKELIDDLAAFLALRSEFQIWAKHVDEAQLRDTVAHYLLTLGIAFDGPAYVRQRREVGEASARHGLPFAVYEAAYAELQRSLAERVLRTARGEMRAQLLDFMLKITSLDLALAVEGYYAWRTRALQRFVAALQRETQDLHRLVGHDSLTGLINHERILALLGDELEARRPVAVIIADLDWFKNINDSFGHLVGDKILLGVTARVLAGVRDFDLVGRLGGDELLMVLKGADDDAAARIAERVRQHVSDEDFILNGLRIPATLSLGIAVCRPGDNVESLVGRADAALYAAKKAGRNCVVCAAHDPQKEPTDRSATA